VIPSGQGRAGRRKWVTGLRILADRKQSLAEQRYRLGKYDEDILVNQCGPHPVSLKYLGKIDAPGSPVIFNGPPG
jgi:hypothetical protein